MNRIVILGTSGSGKTTLARKLSVCLNIPHYDIDEQAWLPNWTQRPREELRARMRDLTSGDAWVISGNYSSLRDIVWARADTVVWLDFPLRIVMWRLVKRTLIRVITREKLWGTGNVERWSNFYARDREQNIIRWALYTHPKHRTEYPIAFQEYSHLQVIRLTHPRSADTWLKNQESAWNSSPG